jgi:hypothetical protein
LPPDLYSPANGAIDVSTSVMFLWGTSSDAKSYDLQVSTRLDFNTTIINKKNLKYNNFDTTGFSNGTKYYWRMRSVNMSSISAWTAVRNFTTFGEVSVKDEKIIPTQFSLAQNYPNPFNPATTIAYCIAKITQVRLEVYNLVGQKIRTLVNEAQPAGYYTARWNGKDEQDQPMPSGAYIYRLTTDSFTETKQMLLIK